MYSFEAGRSPTPNRLPWVRILRTARLPSLFSVLLSALLSVLLAAGCGGGDPPPAAEQPGTAVEVDELNLRFARLPAGFAVSENGARLVLEGDGTMTVEAGELSNFGLDPVAEANGQQARFAALEGGEFLGVQRLGTHLGPAAYARGRFTRDGASMEETIVFVVHPSANRMVSLSYVYAAGDDSAARVQTLLELVGEMEPQDAPEPAGSASEEAA
jgi:hypothetical protein